MKEIVKTNKESITVIEYEYYSIKEDKTNDKVYAGIRILDITFYEPQYHDMAYQISYEYLELINREVDRLKNATIIFTKEEWGNSDKLPF